MITLLIAVVITFILAGCALTDYAKRFFNDKEDMPFENCDLSFGK